MNAFLASSSRRRGRPLAVACLALGLAWPGVAAAQTTRTWSTTSTNPTWSVNTNWSGSVAPVANDSLFFASTTGTRSLTNDIAAGTTFDGITFNSGASAYTLSGNSITLGGNVVNNSSNSQTIALPLSLSSTRSFANNSTNTTVTISGNISGAGGLIKDGTNAATSIVSLTGTNTFAGDITVSAGVLRVDGNGVLGTSGTYAGTITLTGSSTNTRMAFRSDANQTLTGNIVSSFNDSILFVESGATTGSGTVSLAAANPLFTSRLIVGASGVSTVATLLLSNSNAIQNARLEPRSSNKIAFASGIGTFNVGSLIDAGNIVLNDTAGNGITLSVGGNDLSPGIYSGTLSGLGGLTKVGTGTLNLSGANTYAGATTINGGVIAIGNAAALGTTGTITFGGGTLLYGSGINADLSSRVAASNSAIAVDTGTNSVTWASGLASTNAGGFTKLGSGTLTLSGATANTYSGTTTVSAGQLALSKTAGVNAVAGNLAINGGRVSFGANNQIADTAAVTMSGSTSVFNGTGQNAGAFNLTETIASLAVTGGVVNTGVGAITVTGAGTFDATTGYVEYLQNSGGSASFGGLSLVGMTGTTAAGTARTGFAVGGGVLTTLTVGAGGLSLDGSNLLLQSNIAATAYGRLVLGGGVTTTGSVASSIMTPSGQAGIGRVELSGTAGTVSRTFTMAAGGADLTIAVPVTNGAATTAGIVKAGGGTLTLSGSSSFNGGSTISEGTLRLGNANALGASTGSLAVNAGTLDLGGFSVNVGALSGSSGATITTNASAGTATLTTTAASNSTFAGTIQDNGSGLVALTKAGSGTLTLSGINTYSGATAINAGMLVIPSPAALPGWNVPGRWSAASGGALAVGDSVTDADFQALLATGNFLAGAAAGFDTTTNRTYGTVLADTGAGALGLVKLGAGTLTLSNANTYSGGSTITAGRLVLGDAAALGAGTGPLAVNGGTLDLGGFSVSVGSLSGSSGATITTDASAGTATLTATQTSDASFAGTIQDNGSGVVALTKSGPGVLTLSGAAANTYSGTTTVSAGRLALNKTAGVNAVPGNLVITDAAVSFGANNQIADGAAVTMSGSTSVFNGTGFNVGSFFLTETIGSVAVTGGIFQTGNAAAITVTGTGTFDATTGYVEYLQNSGASASFGGLSLIGMTGTTAISSARTGFAVGGSGLTPLTVGAGGLSLDGSNLLLQSANAATAYARLILNGDVTTAGSGASSIMTPSGQAGIGRVELSSTAGTVSRTFTTATGGADLTIAVPVTNGSATTAGIVKAGGGTLTLSASNSYTGGSTISEGTLRLGNANALGAPTGPLAVNAGTLDLGGFSVNVGALSGSAGAVITTANAAGTATLTSSAASNSTFAGTIQDNGSGLVGLAKDGLGLLTFTGNNAYSGPTAVNAGGMLVDGAHSGAGLVTVANAARFGGDGSLAGGLTLLTGAQFIFNPLATLDVTGAVTLDNAFGVANLVNGDGSAINWSSIADGTYTLIGTTSTFSNITNFGAGNAADIGAGRTAYFQNGSLQLVIVPEPGAIALAGLGIGSAAAWARRRLRKA